MKSKKEIIAGWVAVQRLIDDMPISSIECPSCGNKTLKKNDIFFQVSKKLERNIYCITCNASTSLLKEIVDL